MQMSAEDVQLIVDTTIDGSITKRDFIEVYHQHGAQVVDENQKIKISLGEKLTFSNR